MLPETTLKNATLVADKIRLRLVEFGIDVEADKTLDITASFGVSEYQVDVSGWEHLLKLADDALYRAKERGRNCVVSSNAL